MEWNTICTLQDNAVIMEKNRKEKKMKKCPACGSSRYKEGYCKKCGFLNVRLCINCGKPIPRHRSNQEQTCSLECSHDWNHSSIKQREIKKNEIKK